MLIKYDSFLWREIIHFVLQNYQIYFDKKLFSELKKKTPTSGAFNVSIIKSINSGRMLNEQT